MDCLANNIIVINRGDTYEFMLGIQDDDGSCYELTGNDTIYFGVMMPRDPFEDAIIKKKYNATEWFECNNFIIIKPEDTVDLFPGKYYYSVKLKMDHDIYDEEGIIIGHEDKVVTIINKTKFIICD